MVAHHLIIKQWFYAMPTIFFIAMDSIKHSKFKCSTIGISINSLPNWQHRTKKIIFWPVTSRWRQFHLPRPVFDDKSTFIKLMFMGDPHRGMSKNFSTLVVERLMIFVEAAELHLPRKLQLSNNIGSTYLYTVKCIGWLYKLTLLHINDIVFILFNIS